MAQEAITRNQFQEKLKLILDKDDKDCEILVTVYNEVKTCTENSPLIKGLVLQHDPDFFARVEQKIKDLRDADRPILVIGESSAGKSSFLNLLIGRKVLPELARPCTHCMCSIKKGTTLEARVSSLDGSDLNEPEVISEVGKSDQQFRDELKKLVNKDNREKALDRCIEISVPSSILEDNLYLVDTPGFGENEQLTESLVKYLPKAIGIIFVLNATVSLGIADDRGVLILNEIKRLHEGGEIPSFDPTKVIFFANKWDQVPEEEREDHLCGITEKLKNVWPYFQEDKLLPLSVQYVSRLQSTNRIPEDYQSATEDYQTVLNKIHETVEHCGNARSRVHRRLLLNVFQHIKTFVDVTVTHVLLSAEENQVRVKSLQGHIKELESTHNKERKEIEVLVDVIEKQVVEEFHQYLNNVENKEHIFPWGNHNIPKGNRYDKIKYAAHGLIRGFIEKAFTEHMTMSQQVQDFENRMSTLKIYKIQEESVKLLHMLANVEASCADEREFGPSFDDLPWTYIAAAIALSPISVPLRAVGLIPYLPFSGLVWILKEKWNLGSYRANPIEYLDRWSKKIISEEFSKTSIKRILLEKSNINHALKTLNRIKRSITDLKHMCDHLMNTDVVPEGFYEIRDLCHRMKEKLTMTNQY